MAFQIQPVPTPGKPQPFQPPQHYDPASVIMQAAQLRQQRDLAEQQMQQKSVQSFVESIQAAAHLKEQAREADMHNQMAQQTVDIARGKVPFETAQMAAHAKLLEAQANMLQGGGDDAINGVVSMLKNGTASPSDVYSLTSRWAAPQKQKLVAVLSRSGINLKQSGLDTLTQQQQIKTQESTAVQMPIKMTNAVLPALNLLDRLSDKLPRTDIQLLNQGGIALLKKSGSVHAQALATQTNNVVQAFQQQFGKGSDKKLDADFDSLSAAQSPAQLKIAVALTKADIISKRNALANKPLDYTDANDNITAPMPKFKARDYLQSLGSGYNHDEALSSLMNARQAGLIED